MRRGVAIWLMLPPLWSPLVPAESILKVVTVEYEEGSQRYSRLLLSTGWLRIDDGPWSLSALLFDRRRRQLHAIDHVEQDALPIGDNVAVDRHPPLPIDTSVSGPEPLAGGRQRYRLLVNGRECLEQVVEQGLLPELRQAQVELRQALAPGHRLAAQVTPIELLDPCDLALNAYYPELPLANGLAVVESDWRGRRSMLIDYEWLPADAVESDWNRLP